MNKKLMRSVVLTAIGAVLVAPIAACDNSTEIKPEHVAAVAADCTQNGNIEYWKNDGKYYSDEKCTVEITLAETVIEALGHDFTGSDYGKDETGHWKICVRDDCDAADAKQNHADSGTCVCGYEIPSVDPVTKYSITVASGIVHGTVETDVSEAEEGDEIAVTVTSDDGYELRRLKANDTDITETQSFTMPAEDVVITAEFSASAYSVTYDLDGGTGDVPTASYAAGEKFYLPAAPTKEAANFAGWSDGENTYAAGAEYTMSASDVEFTAEWNEFDSYVFGVVTESVLNENVTLKPGKTDFVLNTDHIGNVANNENAAIVFDVDADADGFALLYFTACDRQGEFTFDDAYSLEVNGVTVASDTDMSKGSTAWDIFNDYRIANVKLVRGKNRIVVNVTDTRDLAGNVKGITLKSDTVVCSAYVDPDKAWTHAKEFTAIDGTGKAAGVTTNGYANASENCIGNMQNENTFVSFRLVSDTDTVAAVWLNACKRENGVRSMCDALDVYVNGKPVTCYSRMPSGAPQWTEYEYVRVDLVELKANVLTEITFVSRGGDTSAYNIRGIKLVTETERNISLTASDLYGYASEWTNTDIAFVTEAGGNKAIVPGIHTVGGVGTDVGSVALGGISGNTNAEISFTVTGTADSRAVICIDACHRGLYYFHEAFELKVNGKTVFSSSAMPAGGTEWTQYETVALAEIELAAGDNEIRLSVISSETGKGCNIAGMSFKTESGSVSLKSE